MVVCLPGSFSPLSPSPYRSSSASSSSPPSYPGGALNCRSRSDVSRRKCMCEASSAKMIASTSASSLAPTEATRSVIFCSATASCIFSQAAPVVIGAAGGGGGGNFHIYRGRLLSSSISYTKMGRNGLGLGEWSRIWTNDQKGETRWKASPAKDTSRDILTDPAEASRQRLTITRSGDEQEDDENGSQSGELAEEEGNLSEKERLLKSEVSTATVTEKDDGGFGNATAIGTVAAGLGLVIVLGGFGSVGYLYKDQLNDFLIQFSDFLEGTPLVHSTIAVVIKELSKNRFFWLILADDA